jgi:hypothetical protein
MVFSFFVQYIHYHCTSVVEVAKVGVYVINFYLWLYCNFECFAILSFSLSWEQRESPHYYLVGAATEESRQQVK